MARHVLMAELENIALNQLLPPGDTLSHASAKECVEQGLAKRTEGGYFMTRAGYRAIESPRWWVESGWVRMEGTRRGRPSWGGVTKVAGTGCTPGGVCRVTRP